MTTKIKSGKPGKRHGGRGSRMLTDFLASIPSATGRAAVPSIECEPWSFPTIGSVFTFTYKNTTHFYRVTRYIGLDAKQCEISAVEIPHSDSATPIRGGINDTVFAPYGPAGRHRYAVMDGPMQSKTHLITFQYL